MVLVIHLGRLVASSEVTVLMTIWRIQLLSDEETGGSGSLLSSSAIGDAFCCGSSFRE